MPEPKPIVPAAYLPFVHATVARMLAEIARDIAYRADEDARVQQLAPVPDDQYTADLVGRIYVDIAVHGVPEVQPDEQLATHLHAMRATPR